MTQTIGQRLKAKREEERHTLEKVFEATRIRLQYLEALESDDHSIMPSPVQARGYLRNYAEYLGLDAGQMLRELREINGQQASEEVIGPADLPVSTFLEVKQEVADQPAVPAPESLDDVQDTPAADEPATPAEPKPARRKKAESAPKPAVIEAPTKRRGRKKAVPEAAPAAKTQTPREEEITSSAETVPQADAQAHVEALAAPVPHSDHPRSAKAPDRATPRRSAPALA